MWMKVIAFFGIWTVIATFVGFGLGQVMKPRRWYDGEG